MKKRHVKLLSLLLSLIVAASSLNIVVSAAPYISGANSASSSYESNVYYQNLSAVPLTGDGRLDVIAIALSQLGYQEGNADGEYGGTVAGTNNYTEFNRNMGSFGYGYGGSNYSWCASFVSFCLLQSGCTTLNSISDWCRSHQGDSNYIWREVSCSKWAAQLRACGYFRNKGSYTPRSGDLIFFKSSNSSYESHIGFVVYTDESKVYTIEGNTSSSSGLETNGGGVYFKSYSLDSSYIAGYGELPYKTVSNEAKIDYSGASPSAGLYVATKNKYIYENQDDSTYKWLLPKYSLFEVTGVAANGRLLSKCKINGQEITGYIKNNTDRIIQMTVTPPAPEGPDDNTGNDRLTVSSLEIIKKPHKLFYLTGEDINLNGIKVNAKFSDNSNRDITDYSVSEFDSSHEGKQTLTISYGGKSASFTVYVCEKVSASMAFSDVAETAWYTEYIDYALSRKMISGKGNGTFDPEGTITRAEFVQLLANISDVPCDIQNVTTNFTDVPAESWYAPAIKWATDMEIVRGNGDDTFCPNDPVTREQICVLIVNYIEKYLDITLSQATEKVPFNDEDLISSWAYDAVYLCRASDLVRGIGDNLFAPLNTATRAEGTTLLVNFHKRYIK